MSDLTKVPLSKALVSFDSLPDSAHVDVRTVADLYGCSVATVWRRAAAGVIPAPKKFGHHARWNAGQLRANLMPEGA
ncbi:helix-turn-helix transcriptional regulator [Paraburkholderia bannensis]|uniref:helix-turn-helix transcriptional regulator n=1 Tax=Paraburkholderia bannensis TaxID=765414 RepID=UPI002AC35805|nr:transcriptional regulator [Paraburkholderia bannensis]